MSETESADTTPEVGEQLEVGTTKRLKIFAAVLVLVFLIVLVVAST